MKEITKVDDMVFNLMADFGYLVLKASRREDWGEISKIEEGFNEVLEFVKNNQGVVETDNEVEVETEGKSLTVDVSFEDLGKEDSPEV